MKVLRTPALKPVEILQDAGYTFMPVFRSNKLIGFSNEDWAKIDAKIKELDAALKKLTPEQQLMHKYYLDGEEAFWTACYTINPIEYNYDRLEINSYKYFMQVANSCCICPAIETDAEILYMSDELMDNHNESDFFDLKNIGDIDYE